MQTPIHLYIQVLTPYSAILDQPLYLEYVFMTLRYWDDSNDKQIKIIWSLLGWLQMAANIFYIV